ncbi:MAG TPA: SDR family oxidoreductase [Gemmatimonadaceae bacterium]|nr:SDR family oxidoreductase [Gemmatimonadaceae bacterium]
MDLGIRGRVALVSASSRGLGRAIATELGAAGVRLVLCARDEGALQRTAADIVRETGADVDAIPADLSKREDVQRLLQTVLERLEHVDILVTNAGGPPSGPFESLDADAWDTAYRLTLQSAVELTRGLLPEMKRRRWGRILNVTSITVKQPVENLMLSNSLRAAVTGFARTLANEVAPYGITVNNLLPGYTGTDRVLHLAEATSRRDGVSIEEVQSRIESQIPMGRMGEPAEFAALAAFLASERASYITAQSIAVDGGWIRGLY